MVLAICRAEPASASAVVGSSRVWVNGSGLDRRVALHALRDAVHHLHRLARIFAGRAFRRQHHRVGAVVDRGRDVADLGARRSRRSDHRFEHLRRDHHRLAGLARGGDDPVLQRRHLLGRKLDAEVAARDHHRVGERDDVVQAVDRRRLLDLGEQRGAVADQRARFGDVLGPLDERQGDPVGALLQREREVVAVLVGQRRDRHHDVGDVDALLVGHHPADLHFA